MLVLNNLLYIREVILVVIDDGHIVKLPPDLVSRVFEEYSKPLIWYEHFVFKTISVVVSVIALITLILGLYFFLRGYKLPYKIRFWFSSVANLLRKKPKYEYLTCVHHSVSNKELFELQVFIYKIDRMLWHMQLVDKANSIGLKSWIKPGDVPTTEIINGIDALAESFTNKQKSRYRILKATWSPIIGLTVDRDIILVYIHSVMTLRGITLRERLLDDNFLVLLDLVEKRSATKRQEFGEKEITQLINLVSTLIPEAQQTEFNNSVKKLFLGTDYKLTNSQKAEFVSKFSICRIIGGSINEPTI